MVVVVAVAVAVALIVVVVVVIVLARVEPSSNTACNGGGPRQQVLA
jgi:hypothetical protein